MSDKPSTLGPWLTSCERGCIEELGFVAGRLRAITAMSDGRSVDPKALEQWADVLDLRREYISEFARQAAANGTTQVVLGDKTCLYGRGEWDDRPMPPVMVERPARTLEKAASDVAVAAGNLYGLQSEEYVEVLAELADELLEAALGLRGMSEGMEDGDELERIGAEEDGEGDGDGLEADLEGLARTVMPAVSLCGRASAAASLAEAELWSLASDAVNAVADDAHDLREAALEEDGGDYTLACALKAEALALGAGRAVAAKRGAVAACLLGDACKAASEIVGVKVVSALG